MDRLSQLELHAEQLSAAVKSLMQHRRGVEAPETPRAGADTDGELSSARASVLANIAGIRALVAGPDDFLQDLAAQVATPTLLVPFLSVTFRHMSSWVG